MQSLPAVLLTSIALLTAACSTESEEPGASPRDESPIAGLYAERTLVAVTMDIPTTSNVLMITYGIAEIREEDGAHTLEQSFCHFDVESDAAVVIVVPDALTRSITPIVTTLAESKRGDAVVYTSPVHPTPVGVRLEDPVNDALPKTVDDPRIWDQDGDGKLGVTSLVEGVISGEVYAVRREKNTFDLERAPDGSLGGLLVDSSEQVVLDASVDVLKADIQFEPDPDPTKSRIDLKPLEAPIDCDALVSRIEQVFPR